MRIPRELELADDEVVIQKDGHGPTVELAKKPSRLEALLASWKPLEDVFPDVDDGLGLLD